MGKNDHLHIADFSGGLNTDRPAHKLAPNETPSCYDVTFDRGQLEKRMGSERLINNGLCDPGLKLNGTHGYVRIPANSDFVYGTDFTIVVKFRIDELPASGKRQTLYHHGFSGGTDDTPTNSDLLKGAWLFIEGSSVCGLVTHNDASNNSSRVSHGSTLQLNTNYAVHFTRHTGISDTLRISVYNIDNGGEFGTEATNASLAAADASIDVSDYPVIIGGAPMLSKTAGALAQPRELYSVDGTGGIRAAVTTDGDPSSRGAIQEIFEGTIGEVQLWLGTDNSRTLADSIARVDTQDADVVASKLVGYWMFNEGTGDTVACNRNYSISNASSKDGEVLSYRPQYVAGLVGDAEARHALKFNGYDNCLHLTDQLVSQDSKSGGQTVDYLGVLEKFLIGSAMDNLDPNPNTFEFAFQYHKGPTEYNVTGSGRSQCLCSLYYYFTDNSSNPTAYELPIYIFYIDTSSNLKVDVLVDVDTSGSQLLVEYQTLSAGAVSKDTTYHVALMHYNAYQDWTLYLDGQEVATYADTTGSPAPDIDAIVNNSLTHTAHLFFGMNNDKYHEWSDQVPNAQRLTATAGSGLGGYRAPGRLASSTAASDGGAAMPSNCTIDEVRLWAWEDSSANAVGARDGAGSVGTAVTSGETPPVENLILKYHDKELGNRVDSYRRQVLENESDDDPQSTATEITGRAGLWIYYPFREDWPDGYYHTDTHEWVVDESRYRYMHSVMLPASNVPKWGRGVLDKTTVDNDYSNNEIVHNPVGAIECLQNYVKDDGTQQIVHAQSSTLRSYTTGDDYTNEDEGFQVGRLTSIAAGRDTLFLAHGTRRPTRWDGTNLYTAGIPAPTAPITLSYVSTQVFSKSTSTGDGQLLSNKYYTYRYTYYDKDTNTESGPSPESAAFATNPAFPALGTSDDISLTLRIPRGGNPRVTHYRIYRSEALDTNTGDLQNGSDTGRYSSRRGSFWSEVAEIEANTDTTNLGNTGSPSTDTWIEGAPESELGARLKTVSSGNVVFFQNQAPPLDPEFVVFWRDRLFYAKTTEHPSRIYWSEPGEPENFVADNFLSLDEGDGQSISAVVPLFNYLVVFKQNSIWTISEDGGGVQQFGIRAPFGAFKIHTNVGCASHFSAQKLDENSVLFVGTTGLYQTDGRSVRYLSKRIEPEFRSNIRLARLPFCVATVYKQRNLYLFAITESGEDQNGLVYAYDYVQDNFSRWRIPARTLIQTEDSLGIERIFWGGTKTRGYVHRLDSSDTDGAEFIRPASPTEPNAAALAGTASDSGAQTNIVNSSANWNDVTGDKMRGMSIRITDAGTGAESDHVIVFTDASGSDDRVWFFPPLSASTVAGDTYLTAAPLAEWESSEFILREMFKGGYLQALHISQVAQSTTSNLAAFLAVDRAAYVENRDTISTGNTFDQWTFVGAWGSGNVRPTSRGRLHQFKIEQYGANRPFYITDLAIAVGEADNSL